MHGWLVRMHLEQTAVVASWGYCPVCVMSLVFEWLVGRLFLDPCCMTRPLVNVIVVNRDFPAVPAVCQSSPVCSAEALKFIKVLTLCVVNGGLQAILQTLFSRLLTCPWQQE